jgi:hypothetical protein
MLEMSIFDQQKNKTAYEHPLKYMYKISNEKNKLVLESPMKENGDKGNRILKVHKDLISTTSNPTKKINYGRWGKFEHENFKKAILMYGNNWKNVLIFL